MLKKAITYKDFNDTERTEEFRFHLSKAEITDMELEIEGGLSAKLQAIVNSNSTPEILKIFKDFILKSYGVLTDDGKAFLKTDPITGELYANRFKQTKAFEEFYIELLSNANVAAEFINGIMPKELMDEVEKQKKAGNLKLVENNAE